MCSNRSSAKPSLGRSSESSRCKREDTEMAGRRVGIYFSWSRPREVAAELGVLENRYPTLFEFRRALWPLMEHLRDPSHYDQSIAGFFDHIVLPDFDAFRATV